jgi:hypothetical protein
MAPDFRLNWLLVNWRHPNRGGKHANRSHFQTFWLPEDSIADECQQRLKLPASDGHDGQVGLYQLTAKARISTVRPPYYYCSSTSTVSRRSVSNCSAVTAYFLSKMERGRRTQERKKERERDFFLSFGSTLLLSCSLLFLLLTATRNFEIFRPRSSSLF